MTTSETSNEDLQYAALADRAQRGELKPTGQPLYGEDAAETGRSLLMQATGASNVEDATHVALGRPRLGESGRTETRTWKVRTPATLDQDVRAAAERRGISVSEYIRIAAAHQVEEDAAA